MPDVAIVGVTSAVVIAVSEHADSRLDCVWEAGLDRVRVQAAFALNHISCPLPIDTLMA